MSRPTFIPKQVYIGTGSLKDYSFNFKIEALSQLQVVVLNASLVEIARVRGDDDTIIDTVTFNPIFGGGSVKLLSNLGDGFQIGLFLANDEPTQPFEFSNKTTFSLKVLERALDWILGPSQRLAFRARQALRINDFDDENYFNPQLPIGIGSAFNRTFAVSPDGSGLVFGPTTDTINGAVAAAAAAVAAANAAAISEDNAEASAENAAVSEQNTTFYANLFLFNEFIQVTHLDSPISPVVNGALYLADDTSGDVDFVLPALSGVDENWKAAVIKKTDSVYVLNIDPSGADTILDNPTFVQNQQGIGVVFFKESPTNWGARYFAFTESTGMSSLPTGGDEGAALVKNSNDDYDALWDNLEFEGYSARFSQSWYSKGLRDTLEKILNLTYLGPLIASFTGSSNVLREKGASVASVTLTVDVTKRSHQIARIVFKQSGTTFQDDNPPTQTGSGTTAATYSTPFSDTKTFSVEVTDEAVGGDGPSTVTQSLTYNFVYPYYSGAAAPGRTPAQVAALTKAIINSTATLQRNYTTVDGDVYYFAYPAAYGNLVSILDENGFENFSSFTKTVANITGLDGNAVSYNIYESQNPVVAGSTFFTFKR